MDPAVLSEDARAAVERIGTADLVVGLATAVELAVEMTRSGHQGMTRILSLVFFLISVVFVYRSFYSMRIASEESHA